MVPGVSGGGSTVISDVANPPIRALRLDDFQEAMKQVLKLYLQNVSMESFN